MSTFQIFACVLYNYSVFFPSNLEYLKCFVCQVDDCRLVLQSRETISSLGRCARSHCSRIIVKNEQTDMGESLCLVTFCS